MPPNHPPLPQRYNNCLIKLNNQKKYVVNNKNCMKVLAAYVPTLCPLPNSPRSRARTVCTRAANSTTITTDMRRSMMRCCLSPVPLHTTWHCHVKRLQNFNYLVFRHHVSVCSQEPLGVTSCHRCDVTVTER